ncbi:MAG: adenosylcobinamide-GDP ribazoletransferase [Porphyromonadaceae bacterium]|nr:adenosylcobinamide-GDP ribazoletransferase [Porphyromonadaceae bacterium]
MASVSLWRSFLAASSMFTRLPAWRLANLTKEDYEHTVDWWPVIGLITGGVMAGVFVAGSYLFSPLIALLLAIAARLVLTGAFHEDGLGDFFDGFGGGRSREQILSIMKDSHVGSYAVIGYVLYYLLFTSVCLSLPVCMIPMVLLVSDVFAKFVSSLQVQLLPYARTSETSKTGVVYKSSRLIPLVLSVILAVGLPSILLPPYMLMAFILPLLIGLSLMGYIRRRIGGYTGDCCGAIFLLTELACLLAIAAVIRVCV